MGSCVSTSLAHPAGGESNGASRPAMKRRRSKKARREERGRLFSMFGGGAVEKAKKGGGGGCLREEELHRVPGRMCDCGASERACLFTQQGRKGTNQDAMLVWENFCSRDDTIFCGVFDGHGPFGHMVAKKVRDSLPLKISNQWRATNSDNDSARLDGSFKDSRIYEETASISIDEEWLEPIDINESEKLPEMYRVLRQSLLKAFKLMDKELKLHETIDCFCSGTTAVTFIKQGNDLVIGNVGDSRAVLGTRDEDNTLIAVQLTVDLKPNLPREAARIQQCKGRVFALQDEPEVARVWLPNNDSPGLAMARAFGDFCLKDYGLISVPDVTYRHLTGRDEFIVLATDGVWDVLSNKEVVDVVASAPTRATAARALVDCAVRAWRLKYPTSKTDDCAVVCLFLDSSSSSDQECSSQNLPQEPTKEVGSGLTDQISTDALEANALVSENTNSHCSELEHSYIPEDSEEIVPVVEDKDDKLHERCQSTRSLADCISTKEDEEWSALQGITRVNTLLNLPRFLSSDKKSMGKKK